MAAYSPSHLKRLWIRNGGDPKYASLMAAIARRESGGNPGAEHHNTNGTVDRGLWQINSIWGKHSTKDPEANARAAVHVFETQGPKAWTVYKTGSYKTGLAEAVRARAGRQTRSDGLRGAVSQRVQPSPEPTIEAPSPVRTPPPPVQPIISARLAGVNLGPENPVSAPPPPPPVQQQEIPSLERPEASEPRSPTRRAARRRSGRGEGLVKGRGPVIGTPYAGTHTLGNWQSDRAIDVRVPRGTPAYAPASGRVVKVKHAPEGGRISGSSVTIRKADGSNEYFYTHLSAVNVRPGQRIRKGQQIGRTGVASGVPHLHFGQRRGDPRKRKL